MKASDYQTVITHKETGEEIQIDEYIDLYLSENEGKRYLELMNPSEIANLLDLIFQIIKK